MQMNCDFLMQPSTDSIGSVEIARREVENIQKYKEDEADFTIKQAETSNKFVREYRDHQIKLEQELALSQAQMRAVNHNDSILDQAEAEEEPG